MTAPKSVAMANLGDFATPSCDHDEAKEEIIRLLLDSDITVRAALKQLGISGGTLHRWRLKDDDWWQRYCHATDTRAELLVSDSVDVLDQEHKLDSCDPKTASARVALWREQSQVRRWVAERTSKRYAPQVEHTGTVTQSVVFLPVPVDRPAIRLDNAEPLEIAAPSGTSQMLCRSATGEPGERPPGADARTSQR